jgi:anti-sigma regulatory factor (Ser/Thr protein kinase)/GNAT superfamily N-acetyltransferase
MADRIAITLPNKLEYVRAAIASVREVATRLGFSASEAEELEVAVEEAASNVTEHAYDRGEDATFDVILEKIPGGMKVDVKDMGIPFDPHQIPEYVRTADVKTASTSGMGVFLMRALVDECTFVNLGPGGKETHLVKYIKDAAARAAEIESHYAIAAPAGIQEKVDFDVRLMAEHEAIEVSRCAYRSHGYSFFDEHIYYPEKLVELNRKGELISAVAVTRDGTFMGHAALCFQNPEDRIAELTFAFVSAEFRSHGVFQRLLEFLFHVKSARALDGIYAYAVANHIFSQKTNAHHGINTCGIFLATSPASWKFKGIPGNPNQRISVILDFRYTAPPETMTLYPPPQHAEMVRKLFVNVGASPWIVVASADALALAGDSDIKTGSNQSENCAEIFVSRYGADTVQRVRRLLRKFCLEKMAAINLFLNLGDPSTCHLTTEFEKMGFFFAGILPRGRVGDTLCLQYLNNVDLDYSAVATYTDMAKELLGYIQQHDPNEML